MEVLIEPTKEGFRARLFSPDLVPVVEGLTKEDAIRRLQIEIGKQLPPGSHLISIEETELQEETMLVKDSPDWQALRGMYKDDPMFDEWQEAIAERRRKIDEEGEAW